MYLEFQRAKPIRMHHTSSRTNKCFLFLQCVILLWPAITEIWTAVFFLYLPFFRLLYGTGMRVSEATSLLNQDINLEKRVITIRKTKNQRPTPDTCLSVIAPDVKPICGSEEQAAFTPCKCHGVSIFYFSIRIASEPEQGLCVVQNYIKKMQYSALC